MSEVVDLLLLVWGLAIAASFAFCIIDQIWARKPDENLQVLLMVVSVLLPLALPLLVIIVCGAIVDGLRFIVQKVRGF